MKKFLVVILMLLFFLPVVAQEFMTKREVYDFEVGDEYHFMYTSDVSETITKYTITDKFYSNNNDTLFYNRHYERAEGNDLNGNGRLFYYLSSGNSTIFYADLDSSIATELSYYDDYQIENLPSLCDSMVNKFWRYIGKTVYINEYGKGLGKTGSVVGELYHGSSESRLKYYKKGEDECGTPPSWPTLLTIGEVFDYEIGDEFQTCFKTDNNLPDVDRIKITDKFYSAEQDTLFYVQSHDSYLDEIDSLSLDTLRHFWIKTDTSFYTHLDSSIAIYDQRLTSRFYIIHSSAYCGTLINGCEINSLENNLEYGKGLGNVMSDSTKLFYFKKGENDCGTPDTTVSDLLTVQEVFDFDIGDEFHVAGKAAYQPPNADRFTIMDKYYSIEEDTLFYILFHDSYYCNILMVDGFPQLEYHFWTKTDTVFYTKLNLPISTIEHSFELGYYRTHSSALCGSLINGVNYFSGPELENDLIKKEYGQGIGLAYDYYYIGQENTVDKENSLVYYKKGSLECGTPDTTTLGINDLFVDNEMFLVFPNPAKSLITVVNKSQHSFQCKIISPLGQQVISVTLNSGSNQIDVSDLERGLYFVQMSDGIKMGALKIIIE